ncbi:MAG: response regulator [Cyanobacteria bacterium J06598_3]
MITLLPSCSHYLRRVLNETLDLRRLPDLLAANNIRGSAQPKDLSEALARDLDGRLNFLYPDGQSEQVVLHLEQLVYSRQHAQMSQNSQALQVITDQILWWLGYAVSTECVRPKILVVDDTIETLKLTSAILSQASYEVDSVLTGYLALDKVASARPDLILLDVKLPDIDGYAVYRQLQKVSETASIPVIFLSAVDVASEVQGADYLPKPFKPSDLLKRISRHLEAPLPSGRSFSSEWVNRQRQAHQLFSPDSSQGDGTARLALDSTCFFRVTLEGRYLRVSQEFARVCGYGSAAEMMATVNNVWPQVYAHPSHQQQWQAHLQAPNQPKTSPAQLVTKQKTIVAVAETICVVQDKYDHCLFYQGWIGGASAES